MKNLALLLMLSAFAVGCGVEGYSEGERIGTITKFSHKGLFCKSWEGDMNLGGYRTQSSDKGTSIVANIWEFSVRPSDESRLVPLIQQAAESGKRIKIQYREAYLAPLCETESGYFVKNVELLD